MSKISISFEGAETLRAFSKAIANAIEQLREAEEALERDTLPLLENLGDLKSDTERVVETLKAGTKEVIDSSEPLSAGLEDTAQRIEDYLTPTELESEIAAIAEADKSTLSNIAVDGPHLVSCLQHHASVETTESLREGQTHRHPARGTWLDSDRQPISASGFSNQGIFYWQPNPDESYSGYAAKEVMQKYGFTEILFRDGYAVFPESTVLLEVGIADLLSPDRTANFKEAARAITDDVFLRNLQHCASDSFRATVADFLKGRGDDSSWFKSKAQVDAFMRQNELTWHEKEDMMSVQIIPREVHAMVPHDGGVSNAKLRDATANDLMLLAKEAARRLTSRKES